MVENERRISRKTQRPLGGCPRPGRNVKGGLHYAVRRADYRCSQSMQLCTEGLRALQHPIRAPLVVGSSCNCKAARFVLSRASDFDQDTPACDGGAVTLCEPVTLLHCGAASLSRVSTQVPSLWRSPRACRCKVLPPPPPPNTPAGRCETPRRPRW